MTIIEILRQEFLRRLKLEGYSRITKCIAELSEDEVWYQHNKNSNSMGNLVLHLSGNVRQYVIAGIGQTKDVRNRDEEFKLSSRMDKAKLIKHIETTVNEAVAVVNELSQEQLTETRKVQGFDETVLSIIVHVIEHFSYHVGQITYFTKYIKDLDTGYYAGLDLNVTS